MKHFLQIAISVGSLCCFQTLFAQDPVKLSPDMYKVMLHNKQVRVLEVILKPGAKSPMHHHPDAVVYVIKGGTVKFTDAKGHSTDKALKTGEVLWREDEKHEVENVGKGVVHVLEVELD